MSIRIELRKGINSALASIRLRINEPEVKHTETNADISTGLESDILFQADDKMYKKALSDCPLGTKGFVLLRPYHFFCSMRIE